MKYFLCLLILCALASCADKDDAIPTNQNRAILIYLAANNNLAFDAYNSINRMEEALQEVDMDVYVYATISGNSPKIYKIKADNSPAIRSTVIASFGEQNSADPQVMKSMLVQMKSLVPNRKIGLVLWSHATNWLPDNAVKLRSFNDDNGMQTDLKDLEDVIPSDLDFLMFDACSMASVEVLYQLKDKAKFTIASPAEVLSTGMPYDVVLKQMIDDNLPNAVKQVASSYIDYYQKQSGLYQSATISVVDNQYLVELANEMKILLTKQPLQQLYRANLQRLDFDSNSASAGFDFADFLEQHFDKQDLVDMNKLLRKVVVYKGHTPAFLGKPILKFSGLSCYVPTDENKWVHPYYNSLNWSINSGFTAFVKE